MSFFIKFVYTLGAVIVALAVIALFLPSSTVVERRAMIDANRATVFALLNDFHQVNKWSPWLAGDPNARTDYYGPRRGEGATFAWDGNIIGRGSQTITESIPFDRVAMALNIEDLGKQSTVFELSDGDSGTLVVWTFRMDYGFNLVARYLGLTVASVIGEQFETGLEQLKSMAEGLPRADFSDVEIEHIVVEASDIAFQSTSSVPQAAEISDAMGKAFFNILSFIDENSLQEAGAPISISRAFSGSEIRFDAAIPVRGVTGAGLSGDGSVKLGKTYAGPVIRVKHVGSYRTLGRTHDKIAAYLAALSIERNGDAWESYVSDPTRTDEQDLLTYVYYPIVVEELLE